MKRALSVPEATRLGTAHAQSILLNAGVRTLAIKGPSFAELGVRGPRESQDIDLLIHPESRDAATRVLLAAGWRSVSGPIPRKLESVKYSTTMRHEIFPVTIDLHHALPGVLAWPSGFDQMWSSRCEVRVAHHPIVTVSPPHALVLEALNVMKRRDPDTWEGLCQRVLAQADVPKTSEVASAARSIGASQTAHPLLRILDVDEPMSGALPNYNHWLQSYRRGIRFGALRYAVKHAPLQVPRLFWHWVVLDEDVARFWADRHQIPYRGRSDVFRLRIHRAIRTWMQRVNSRRSRWTS